MEGEQEDGRRRKEQSLYFPAAGPSYSILLYNPYSFYIMITVVSWIRNQVVSLSRPQTSGSSCLSLASSCS